MFVNFDVLFFATFHLSPVDAYVCMFVERQDPSTGGLRWSLFAKERCYCQGVVAPEQMTSRTCSGKGDYAQIDDLWITEDPGPIIQRKNWSPAKLDQLLERNVFCCKLAQFFLVLSVFVFLYVTKVLKGLSAMRKFFKSL